MRQGKAWTSCVAALAAAMLAACDEGAARMAGEDRTNGAPASASVRFAVVPKARLPTQDPARLRALWAPLFADMRRRTGLAVEPLYPSTDATVVMDMRADQVDAGWFSNASALDAVQRADGEVFARASDPSGAENRRSVLIANAASSLTLDAVLRCDGSLSFGPDEADSKPGARAPMTYLFGPRDIDPATCFGDVRAADPEANLLAVAAGVLDAATSDTTDFARLARARPDAAARVRVIWASPSLPEDPLVWRKDLDPAVKEKLRQFFLTYGAGDGAEARRQREVLAALDLGVFRPADDAHLVPVREMEAAGQWLQARKAGDAAALTAASRRLDAVRAERAEIEARAGMTPGG